jgi:hypothetical protein
MSSAAPTAKTLAQAKVKRQKQIVAIGSVILLALVGYQLPKLLGGHKAALTTSTTTEATTSAVPGSPLAVAPGKLPNTDRVTIEPQTDQLVAFGLFKSKDPFVQQLSTLASTTPSEPATPATPALQTTTTPFAPTTTSQQPRRTAPNAGLTPVTTAPSQSTTPATPVTPAPVTPSASTPATTATTTTTPATAPTSVAVSTNGACEDVAVNGTFPGSEDIFRVVSIAMDGKSAKIGVVGGSYDNGQAAATLKLGIRLTLVNTADGTRYVLILKSRCDAGTEPATGTTTTSTSTVAAPAPTTNGTATAPIVTDALDTTTPSG